VLLANSITLTPGTITVSVHGDEFCVHALDSSLAEGIEEGGFVHILRKMEALW
jgi:multicomponent Na+:H+ antiporter subunit E